MKDLSTEQKILEVARKIFIQKGMDGSRMQEIADEAGINKALLHYYFRSKEKLFEAVFVSVFEGFFKALKGKLDEHITVEEKIDAIISNYSTLLDNNPFVPQFLINEINRNPQMLKNIMESQDFNPQIFLDVFGDANKGQTIHDPRQFIVSIIGMMIFPYAAKNLVQLIYFRDDANAYHEFLQERKIFIKEMALKMIKQ